MKNMKKKGLLLGALSVLCLSSVGFASWVISQDATKTADGNITAETVVDNSIDLTVSWSTDEKGSGTLSGNPTIHYGKAPSSASAPKLPDWLHNTGKESSLTAYLKIETKKYSAIQSLTITVDDTADKISDDTLVKIPSTVEFTLSNLSSGSAIVPITFSWGTLFGSEAGSCPETKFENAVATDKTLDPDETMTNAEYANHLLTSVEGLIKENAFKVTVTATAKTTNA